MISVVIPTYNGAQLVGDALASVLAQTRHPDEIVIVDDCSTDNTASVVEGIARGTAIPIRFSRLPSNTGGPSRPLNVAIASARNEIIAILEQDDVMRPGRIQTQMDAVHDHPDCSVTIGRFSVIGNQEGDMRPIWPTAQFHDLGAQVDATQRFSIPAPEAAFSALLKRNFAGSCSNFCFTRQSWRKIGGFDERIKRCTDLDFMLKAVLAGPLVIANETLFDYRWQSGSLNHSNVDRTNLELTVVRWRAAMTRPAWAGSHVDALRKSIRSGTRTALQRRDLGGIALVARTLFEKNGFRLLKASEGV